MGVHVVVSAGNNNTDARSQSPARAKLATTIGASTTGDYRWSSSNYGPAVDIFAPGDNVISAWINSPNNRKTMSGTSQVRTFIHVSILLVVPNLSLMLNFQACPHVAGLISYLIRKDGYLSPQEMKEKLRKLGTWNILDLCEYHAIAHCRWISDCRSLWLAGGASEDTINLLARNDTIMG